MKTSRKNVVKNKCMTRKFRVRFLIGCQNWYWEVVDSQKREWWEKIPINMARVIWCYDYGCRKGYIDITFEWFKDILLNKIAPEEELYPKERKPFKRTWIRRQDHGGSTKYQKGEGHGIKDRERVEAKKLWREYLNKGRTSGKRGPRKDGKLFRSQYHRAWVKQILHRENYEAFHKREREVFYGRWCWD
jgi:hypothetical protein